MDNKDIKDEKKKHGLVRVGRCVYKGGKRIDPEYKGFTPIVCLTQSSAYGALGPYCLVDEKGRIMENIWQFSKVYPQVPRSIQQLSRYQPEVIWDHPAEVHVKNGAVTEEYLKWRMKGMAAKHPIRYPVGFNERHTCVGALRDTDPGTITAVLKYIPARKAIYLPEYCRLVRKVDLFNTLKQRLDAGENLLIIEVDGPHEESMDYYKTKYTVNSDFIENSTMLATKENLSVMLNDDRHNFGHGYCLAAALLDLDADI